MFCYRKFSLPPLLGSRLDEKPMTCSGPKQLPTLWPRCSSSHLLPGIGSWLQWKWYRPSHIYIQMRAVLTNHLCWAEQLKAGAGQTTTTPLRCDLAFATFQQTVLCVNMSVGKVKHLETRAMAIAVFPNQAREARYLVKQVSSVFIDNLNCKLCTDISWKTMAPFTCCIKWPFRCLDCDARSFDCSIPMSRAFTQWGDHWSGWHGDSAQTAEDEHTIMTGGLDGKSTWRKWKVLATAPLPLVRGRRGLPRRPMGWGGEGRRPSWGKTSIE